MKREIKFRAWDGSKYITFDNHQYDLIYNDISGWNVAPNLQNYKDKWTTGESSETSEEFVLEQFIGCSDMYGNSIFEGDILETYLKDERVVIEFKGGQFVGKNIDKNHPIGETQNRNWFQWEVIGNIHENKNLIE